MKIPAALLLCVVTATLANKPDGKAGKYSPTSEEKPNPTVTFIDNRTAAPEQKPAEQKSPDWYTTSAPAEWALVFVGVAGIIAAICSLKAINNQLVEMRKQVCIAQKSADAARVSADIAAGVSLPALVIHEFTAANGDGAALTAMLQLPKINLVIKNYGKTPALLHSWSLIFTCEKLPDVPVYFGFPGSGIMLTKEVIKPDEPYALTVAYHWNRQQFSLEDVQAIIEHRKTLIAYGYVCYGDIFGNPLRRFKFCEVALNLSDGWIDWQSDMSPPSYVGTDQYPMREAAPKKGVEGQSSSADTKTQNEG